MELTTEYSPWFILLCVALGAIVSWILYQRSRDRYEWSPLLVGSLAAIRGIAIAFLAFFLLGPLIKYLQREIQKPIIVIAHDGSMSMVSSQDSAVVKAELPNRLNYLQDRLSDKYEVRTFTYGEQVREGLDLSQNDVQSDMGEMFQEIDDRYSGSNLGAIIIDGDGIYNRGRDPLYVPSSSGVPIYTIATGDTTIRKDLILSDVDHNRFTYLGNEFPIVVRYRADHLNGKRTVVKVFEGSTEKARANVSLNGDPAVGEIPLFIKAEKAGIRRYVIAFNELEGESSAENNRAVIYVEVLDDRQKILLVGASPHPDIAAIGDALEKNEGYEVIRALEGQADIKPEDADLVILHQIPNSRTPKNFLANAIAKKTPLWYVIGSASDLSQLESLPGGIQIIGANRTTNDVQSVVQESFSTFVLEQEEKRAITRFPPMQVPFGEHRIKQSAIPFLMQKIGSVQTDYPLLSLNEQEGVRYAVLHGEGIWRWRIYDHAQNGSHEITDKLIGKVAQYLAVKEDKSKFRVSTEQEYDENERITFNAELYNDNYEPINDPEAQLVIVDEEGNETPYTFNRTAESYRLDAGSLPAGSYQYRASVESGGEKLRAQGEFTVRSLLAEKVNLVADHDLLMALSERSGGIMVGVDGIEGIAQAIEEKKEVVAKSTVRATLSDLVDLRWPFYIILALLTLEWALRRRNGAY